MAKLSIVAGATSQSVNIFIQDSSSTTGVGLNGIVFNTSGLTAYYTFTGANATSTSITLATLAAVNSAYSSGGFKELDATNQKGLYRLDLPDAVLATSKGRCVTVYLQGVTNMAPCLLEIELTGWNNQDSVHGGLTSLPNTACTTNASLLTSGTGTDQLSVSSGKVDLGKVSGSTTAGTNLSNIYANFEAGTATAGASSTITLRAGASATNSFYNLQAILLTGGTGSGQTNVITAYNGTTKVATLENSWATSPDNTTTYVILGRVG